MLLLLYNLIIWFLWLFLSTLLLIFFSFFSLEKRHFWKSKLGFYLPRNEKKERILWAHAASAGELRSLLPLLPYLKQNSPQIPIFISLSSFWGYRYAQSKRRLIAPYVEKIFFLPLDVRFLMRRLMLELTPKILIITESELWLNLIRQAKFCLKDIRILLINARISERSFKFYSIIKKFIYSSLLCYFDKIYLQNDIYKYRFLALCVPNQKLEVIGNTKFSPLQEEETTPPLVESIKDKFFIITAGSIRNNKESALIWHTYLHLLKEEANIKKDKDFLLILAPRYPSEKLLKRYLAEERVNIFFASTGKITSGGILILDTFGDLASYYKISHLTIVGGSFYPKIGGHNIIEPVILGKIVIFGPYLQDQYKQLADLLINLKCGFQSSYNLSSLIRNIIENYNKFRAEAEPGIKKIQLLFKELPQKYVKLITNGEGVNKTLKVGRRDID
jgi:3-deoxy-D-manno-octulosonic-acid transferase